MNKEENKIFTTIAFIIGFILIDNLTSTEQSAVGNFFMLIGQTLCTNSGFHFNNDWKNLQGNEKINEWDLLYKIKKVFNNTIK